MPRILLDPGHGRYGNKGVLGYWEGQQMWYLGQYLADEFRALGWIVGITRPSINDDPSLEARGKMAKGYDLFISLHSNAPGSSAKNPASIRGVSIYDSVADKLDYIEVPLAAEIARIMNTPNLGVKHWESATRKNKDYFGALRNAVAAGCPDAMLIEHGYHTNEIDARWLLNHNNLKRLAKAEAALVDYLFRLEHGGIMLKYGDKGQAVYDYQTACKEAGYDIGNWENMKDADTKDGRDGSFGNHMKKVTEAAQKEFGIKVTGYVDADTYGRIVNKAFANIVNKSCNYPTYPRVLKVGSKVVVNGRGYSASDKTGERTSKSYSNKTMNINRIEKSASAPYHLDINGLDIGWFEESQVK